MADPEADAIAAYWRFFEGTNSRDSTRVTDALNYPHVRISARGKPGIAQERKAHARRMTFDAMLETGWDHTVGAEPVVLHVSDDKVHIRGGWTRYNSANEPIMSNEVCYIVTRTHDGWGLQSRFGTDSELFWGKPEDRPEAVEVDHIGNRAVGEQVVRAALEQMGNDNKAAAGYCRYPCLTIHPGRIDVVENAGELAARMPPRPVSVQSVEAIQVGATSVNVIFSGLIGERAVQGLVMVRADEGDRPPADISQWGIKGMSLITT